MSFSGRQHAEGFLLLYSPSKISSRDFINEHRTSPAVFPVVLAVIALTGGVAGIPVADSDGPVSPDEDEPEIVEVYPNPTAARDDGEFITLSVPAGANLSAYTLTDEQARVPLSEAITSATATAETPDRTRVTFSTNATLTAALSDRQIRPLADRIRLANDGEQVRLLRNGTVVDELHYERATEGQVYDAAAGEWHPLQASEFQPVSASGGTAAVFALPDNPDRAVEFLDSAEERLLLAGYTISSQRVVDTLIEARESGVNVTVLAEGAPVGGLSGDAAAALDSLRRAGIEVQVLGGERARYRYHHAKYAIADDRALVTTENWKPSGTGGQASRGWAVITEQQAIVDGLESVFRADTGWVDTIDWDRFDPTITEGDPAAGDYPSNFEPETVAVEQTTLLLAPDNARQELRRLVEDAEESIDIKQVRIGGEGFPLLQAVLDAAERGVEVRILLSGAWYVEEENRELKAWLEEQADARDLPLSVRIADPDNEFEKIHAKGVVVDEQYTLVGSMNWNNNSFDRNREVALLLESEDAAAYYTEVFDADWEREDDGRKVSVGVALVALFVVVLAILGASRVRFEG